MRILVLGGSGFVGSRLKKYLSSYYSVFTASRSDRASDFIFDLGNPETFSICENNFDVIINCIVDYTASSIAKFEHEVVSKCRFLEFISDKKIHYVDISSISAINENKHSSAYNFSKFLSDEVTEYFGEQEKLKYTILRYAQIFDLEEKGKHAQRAFYYFIDTFKKQGILNIFGNPTIKRSYIPIEILVKTVRKSITDGITGSHNVIMPDTYSANDLVKEFSNVLPFPKNNILHQPAKFASEYYIPACSKSFSEFMLQQESCIPFFTKLLLAQ